MVLRTRGRLLGRALALLFAAAIAAQLLHSAVARELAGSEAPDFALKSTTGRNIRLSEFRSEVVALVFWASWCGDCRAQLPALGRLQQELAADGLQVLAVSLDHDMKAAREAAAGLRVDFPVLHDGLGEVGRLYRLQRLPALVLVDREGRVRERRDGDDALVVSSLRDDIRAALDE
jgi:peroxiredoxin